jgi:Ca2+-binding RTX toxin-like protein
MSSIQTLTPNNAQNLNAANWSYSQGSAALPAGFRYLMDGGQPVTLYNASTGFYGAALVASTGQVMVTFEGTNFFTGSAEFTAAQVLDDAAITAGIDAPSYQTALNFTQSAVTDAEAQGYNASDIYLDGHSLGGADVEYVASQLGIPGTTFGAPGIPAGDIPSGATQDLTNYVEYGDPVGNYAQGGYEGNIVQSDNIVHYGTVDWTGSYLGIVPLTTAAVAYDAGDYSAAIAALAVALPFHLLGTYAESLGVPPLANGDLSSGALGDGEAAAAAIFSSLFKSGAAGTSGTSPGATNNSQTLSQTGSAATSSGDVFGGDSGVTITGGAAPLHFVGGTGAVSVMGGSGNTTMFGATSDANSVLIGGSGNNTLVGGMGASTLIGGTGNALEFTDGAGPALLVGAAGASAINGTGGSGAETVQVVGGKTVVALNGAADTVVGGAGAATVVGGAGTDVYGFIKGHAGGTELIGGLKSTDTIVFGGYGSGPIVSEAVQNGSDVIALNDGTVVTLEGLDHKVFNGVA